VSRRSAYNPPASVVPVASPARAAGGSETPAGAQSRPDALARRPVDTVIKIGGALLHDPAAFETVIDALNRIGSLPQCGDAVPPIGGQVLSCISAPHAKLRHSARPILLVIPGGGPFADAVRSVDAQFTPGSDASHWMAILAMDQYAHLLVARTTRSTLVDDPTVAGAVCATGRLPVLAPYRWLRKTDPLPHSWDVTSDSIAAWLALDAGAPELILVKATTDPNGQLTDPYLPRLLSGAVAGGRELRVRCCAPAELFALVGGKG
jgi:aspartokinase-like uncharacterized kinase